MSTTAINQNQFEKNKTDGLGVNFHGRDMGQEEQVVIIVFGFIWQIASPTVSVTLFFFLSNGSRGD